MKYKDGKEEPYTKRPPVKRHMDPYNRSDRPKSFDEDKSEGIIEGRNAVIEALRAGRTIDKIYLAKGDTDSSLAHIASKARASGAVVVETDRRKLDAMSITHSHQGVIALASVKKYVSLADILSLASDRGESPLIIVCDEISDVHNLGAIIRTAEAAGSSTCRLPGYQILRQP